jgi:hypothetical protein
MTACALLTPTYRRALARFRAAGIEILVIPGPGFPGGEAWSEPGQQGKGTRLHITIRGSTFSGLWLFVLLHEVAHHVLGHTTRPAIRPEWEQEHAADQYALALLAKYQPAALPRCEAVSRHHIRPLMQAMIDAEIWNHVDGDIARWAGCHLPPEMAEA